VTRLKQFLALAGLTAVEVLRQPVSLLLFITTIALMGLSPLLLLHNFGESGKIVRDGALAFHMLMGFILAGYSACSVMNREIRTGTASAVLSKPVDRGIFFLAKYAGVILVVFFFSCCATAGTLLAEKACEKFHFSSRIVGYFADNTTALMLLACPVVACVIGALMSLSRKRPFVSSAFTVLGGLTLLALVAGCFISEQGTPQHYYPLYDLRLLSVSVLIFLGLSVVVALALLLSIKLNIVMSMMALAVIFLAGWVSQHFFGSGDSLLPAVIYGVLPDWQHFWAGDNLSDGGIIPFRYVFDTLIYAGLYSLSLLAAGMALFWDSELK
jgi:ABC-type transport system involved in multi-copper enzyme maturation permease subunit